MSLTVSLNKQAPIVGAFILALSISLISTAAHARVMSCLQLFSNEKVAPSLPQIFENLSIIRSAKISVNANKEVHEALQFEALSNTNALLSSTKNLQLGERVTSFTKQKIDKVIYPAAGYDAASAFQIFPQARTVIGIDIHPFIIEGAKEITPVLPKDNNNAYSRFSEVDPHFATGIAAPILGRLMTNVEKFRLRKVTYVIEDSPFAMERAMETIVTADIFENYPAQKTSVHGIIEFDSGPGTPIKTYIHLQHFLKSMDIFDNLRGALVASNYQGLLIKGAQRVFNERGGAPGRGMYLFNNLKKNGGTVVNTDHDIELSSYLVENPSPLKTKSEVVDVLLGYNGISTPNRKSLDGVLLLEFGIE